MTEYEKDRITRGIQPEQRIKPEDLTSSIEALKHRIKSISHCQLTVVSDMTGTLIHQGEDGFSRAQRDNINKLLSCNGKLVLVTADPLSAVRQHFLKHLDPVTRGVLYILSSAGYECHRVASNDNEPELVCKGNEIPIEARISLLNAFEAGLKSVAGDKVVFSNEQKQNLLGLGARISLSPYDEQLFLAGSAVDIFPGKSSIFFLNSEMNHEIQEAIFDAILNTSGFHRIIQQHGLYLLRGHNYLDVLANSKGDALNMLLQNDRALWTNRHLLILGDSANDESLFSFNYQNALPPIMRMFVGDNQPLVERVNLWLDDNCHPRLSVYKEGYTKGTEEILGLIDTK